MDILYHTAPQIPMVIVRRILQEEEMIWYKAIHLDIELLLAGKKLMGNSHIYDTNAYTRP